MPRPALDCIKDRRGYPRVKMLEASWDVVGDGVATPQNQYKLLIDGVEVSGSVDWDKTRHLEGEFWCWIVDMYYVFDSNKWTRKPPEPDIKWGPTVAEDETGEDDA